MKFLKHFFSYDFQFYINRISIETVDRVFALVAAGLIVIAIVLHLYARFQKHPVSKRLYKRLFKIVLSIGILEAVWYAARFENISLFGTHFTFLLILLVGIAWVIPALRYRWGAYAQEVKAWDKEQIKQKYLQTK